jgi:hypothetical protein
MDGLHVKGDKVAADKVKKEKVERYIKGRLMQAGADKHKFYVTDLSSLRHIKISPPKARFIEIFTTIYDNELSCLDKVFDDL